MTELDYRDPEWVASTLGIEKNTVYKHLQDGTIPAVRIGRKWLISESRLIRWLEAETQRQTQSRQAASTSASHTLRRMTNYSPAARQLLKLAHAEARRYGHRQLGQEHLLLAMVSDPDLDTAQKLADAGTEPDKVRHLFETRCPPGEGIVPRRLARSPGAKHAMKIAAQAARASRADSIEPRHLLYGILESGSGEGFEILKALGAKLQPSKKHKT